MFGSQARPGLRGRNTLNMGDYIAVGDDAKPVFANLVPEQNTTIPTVVKVGVAAWIAYQIFIKK